jgi:GH15 family glucan-1,4-alpha-glucosidase
MVAAPTSSLPVSPDGKRNWDYRFSWTRDSAMAIRAMNLIGYGSEALDFFHFVRDCVHRRDRLDLMVSIHGHDAAEEQVLGHLAGHRGSGNVRIGNAAAHQIQLDITGPLLDAADLYERSGGIISLRFWREIRHLVDHTADTIRDPDHGIWEARTEPQHHVHSKLMAWVALDRALRLAPLFGGDKHLEHWRSAREEVRQEILEKGFDPRVGSFVDSYGSKGVDAALLLFPIYGFLPPNHPRITGTLDRVLRDLAEGRFLRRYRGDDGIGADEGGFLLCGFWLAEALALAGRVDEALEVMNDHLGAANHVGLLAEEVDPATGTELGNFPQAFSHLGLIQAATRTDLALRMRDEGSARPPRHTFDLPVREP